MQKFLNIIDSTKLQLVCVILFALPAIWPLIQPGFFHFQDEVNVVRVFEMNRALGSGQFPVRWVSDIRYGEPLYNFYAPLPYYLGFIIHLFEADTITITKILFLTSIIFSGITMYYLVKELFDGLAGLLSAVLYMYAPYHSVDIYVRGALSETWALIFFPLIFLFALKLARHRQIKFGVLLSLSLAGLFFTHNIMTMLFMPFYLVWLIYLIGTEKKKRLNLLGKLTGFSLLGGGLAASYLLPAFFERNLIQSSALTNNYFDFRAHFVEIKQFFSTFWGYGPSVWGPNDGLSFQIGVAHWIMLLIALLTLTFNRRNKKVVVLGLVLIALFLLSLFMQHNKSTPIWLVIPLLSFAQFPWRFLGISIFLVSIIGSLVVVFLPPKYKILIYGLALLVVIYNLQFFHPEKQFSNLTDKNFISTSILKSPDSLPKDYVPIYVKAYDSSIVSSPKTLSGNIQVQDFIQHSTSAQFKTRVISNSADIEVPIYYFPGWTVYQDGEKINQESPTNLGLIHFSLSKGLHQISIVFQNIWIRSLANWISILCLVFTIGLMFLKPIKSTLWKRN